MITYIKKNFKVGYIFTKLIRKPIKLYNTSHILVLSNFIVNKYVITNLQTK